MIFITCVEHQEWKIINFKLMIYIFSLLFLKSQAVENVDEVSPFVNSKEMVLPTTTISFNKTFITANNNESPTLTNQNFTNSRSNKVEDKLYTDDSLTSYGEVDHEFIFNDCNVRRKQHEVRRASYLLVYIIVFVYSFLGIIVTCHQYFVTALSRICDDFKLSEDIVGATFMAAGSSAPELATVIISVFSTENDIGISDVIGSAVFNVIFVIALCGLTMKKALQLNWWPLVRNCFFYIISILIMLITIDNGQVSWVESLILIGTYGIYLTALYYNELLEAWANTLLLPFIGLQDQCDKDLDTNYIPLENRQTFAQSKIPTSTENNNIVQSNGKVISSIQQSYQSNEITIDQRESEDDNRNIKVGFGILEQIKFYFLNPVYYICHMTIPDWQEERFHNLYFLTFFVSFIWIAVYSYVMIWMITAIGQILAIPNTVMGLTLIAAGVSVPDAVTSLKVVKKGCADMAVSNAIGSNIFDILICLGFPWFLQTAVIRSSSYVEVCSKGMIYSTMMLLATVVLLLYVLRRNGWKLDKKIGSVLMIGYFLFISIAILWELFGSDAS